MTAKQALLVMTEEILAEPSAINIEKLKAATETWEAAFDNPGETTEAIRECEEASGMMVAAMVLKVAQIGLSMAEMRVRSSCN